jgi:drug/metabolite transporter (DMT)-like permease
VSVIDPVILFRDGGPFMYLIVLMAAGHGLGCLIQLFVARQVDLVPLLWAGVVSIVLTGMLGTALGQVMTYSAVANASAEMKSVLVA